MRKILALKWWFNFSILTLKVWTLLFEPTTEFVDVNPMWVNFLELLLDSWSKYSLISLGNRLGGFIEISKDSKNSLKSTIVKILVNL